MIVLCNFLRKLMVFEQKYSQGFENSYNSHEQYPLEKFFIFTIYQNYTLALTSQPYYAELTFIFNLNQEVICLVDACLNYKHDRLENLLLVSVTCVLFISLKVSRIQCVPIKRKPI